jgi:hypothetical protein
VKATLPYPNVKSLLVVLCIFIGNAQLLDIDIVLFLLLPMLWIITFANSNFIRMTVYGFIFLISLWAMLALVTLQGINANIPYLKNYWLWPIKAAILAFIIATDDQPKWGQTNTWILILFALCLIFVGRFEQGRLYSIFGPNMLYRLFGIILILSLMQKKIIREGTYKFTRIVAFLLGIIGIMLTGSTGGIILVLVAFIYYSYVFHAKIFLLLTIVISLFAYMGTSSLYLASFDIDITAISRVIYKIGTFASSERFVGLFDVFSRPFSFWGSTYPSFSNIWTDSYPYPHNIVAELYAFYGALGIVIISMISIMFFKLYDKKLSSNVYVLTFIIIFFGSLLSGDLSDNYGVVAVCMGYLLHIYTAAGRAGV